MNKIISSYIKLMIKNFLTVALAVALSGSAFAFGPKRVFPTGDTFNTPGSVVAPKKQKKQAPTRAEGDAKSIDFTYANEPLAATSYSDVDPGAEIYEAIFLTSDDATSFAGDQVTSINVTTGGILVNNSYLTDNTLTEVTVFIMEDRNADPVYTQTGKLGTDPLTEYKVTLDTPYTIKAGQSFYVGYYFTLPSTANLQYIPFDGYEQIVDNGWVGAKARGGKTINWRQFGDQLGALCLGCTISGETWPQNACKLIAAGVPSYLALGKGYDIPLMIQSAAMDVNSIEVKYTIGSAEPKTQVINFNTSLGFNQAGEVALTNVVCNEENLSLPVLIELVNVNGEPNGSTVNKLSGTTMCFAEEKGFPRVALLEEGTGTWCGWCPLGIVMMEYVKENYSEYFAPVAIHAQDQMTVSSTSTWINKFASGFPCAFINHKTQIQALSYASVQMMESEIQAYVANYAPALIGFSDITTTFDEEGNVIVNTKVQTHFDQKNNNRFRLAYYITEDGVGPYRQTNYYAPSYGYGYVCAGWEKKGTSVSTVYDDVVRIAVGGVTGVSSSLPAQLVADEEYEHAETISIKDIKNDKINVVAYIVDNATSEVINAKMITVDNDYYIAGVDEIAATDADVVSKTYYNVNGVEVKDPSNGIYILRSVYSDGTVKAEKVVVE